MKSIPVLVCAATLALAAPIAGAGVIEGYTPYSHLVEGNLTSTVFGAGDGFLLKSDDRQTFDGALQWSLAFSVAPDVRAMTGDATFAVPADGVPDGMGLASLALYRSTLDDVSHGRLGDRVRVFDIDMPAGGSWAHAALDGPLLPLGPGLLYSFVFEGQSVANPYFQARTDFLGAPLPGSNPPPAVPEPAGAVLLLAGAALLTLALRRSRSERLRPAP